MAKAKKKAKRRVAAKGKKKAATPAARRKKTATKPKKKVKPKRKVAGAKKKRPGKAGAAVMAKLRKELQRWQALHAQLKEQIRAKESTIAMQMQEIMELKRDLAQLTFPALQ
ncbi:MAG: hypothetical protein ACE5K9_01880 [Candidatus Methylomirabilales bacterium]